MSSHPRLALVVVINAAAISLATASGCDDQPPPATPAPEGKAASEPRRPTEQYNEAKAEIGKQQEALDARGEAILDASNAQ